MAVIGIISDTHGLLRPEALSMIQGVQHIIHAGDIGKPEIIPGLAEIAPVTAIRGNVDVADWTRALPETACVTLLGRRFFVIHDRNDLWFDPAKNGYDGVTAVGKRRHGCGQTAPLCLRGVLSARGAAGSGPLGIDDHHGRA